MLSSHRQSASATHSVVRSTNWMRNSRRPFVTRISNTDLIRENSPSPEEDEVVRGACSRPSNTLLSSCITFFVVRLVMLFAERMAESWLMICSWVIWVFIVVVAFSWKMNQKSIWGGGGGGG